MRGPACNMQQLRGASEATLYLSLLACSHPPPFPRHACSPSRAAQDRDTSTHTHVVDRLCGASDASPTLVKEMTQSLGGRASLVSTR